MEIYPPGECGQLWDVAQSLGTAAAAFMTSHGTNCYHGAVTCARLTLALSFPLPRAPRLWGRSAVHRLSSSGDSSPPSAGQLLLLGDSLGQPGVMTLTQPINPTHSLSARHLHSILARLKDENIFLSSFLKCKYGHGHLKPQ